MNPFQDPLPACSSRPGTARANGTYNRVPESQPRAAHEYHNIELQDFAPGNHHPRGNRGQPSSSSAPAPISGLNIFGRPVNNTPYTSTNNPNNNTHNNPPDLSRATIARHVNTFAPDLETGRSRRAVTAGNNNNNRTTPEPRPPTWAELFTQAAWALVFAVLCAFALVGIFVVFAGGPFARPKNRQG